MNSLEIFWNNKRTAQATQQALLAFFKKNAGEASEAKEFTFKESEVPFDVTGMSLLRLNQKKGTTAVIAGSSMPDFAAKFHAAFASPDPKALETELLTALFNGVEPELNAHQIQIDRKALIFVTGKMVGGWSHVQVTKSVSFPFTTPKGDFTIEVPLIDDEYHAEKTLELYGYSENDRIMVVDDSATTRKVSRHYLAAAGFQNVDEAADGQAAFQKVQGSSPAFALIVADWHMPVMAGIDLLRKVRTDVALRAMPLILVTGERNKEEVATAVKEGVSGYVVKPFEAEQLYKAMKGSKTLAANWAAKNPAKAPAPKKAA